MSTIKVNYKSDLPPIRVELTLGGEVQQIPSHDFVLRFFTVYPHRHYDCIFEDGEWTNMEQVDSTHLKVYITNHALGVGPLHCMYISKAPHEGYERNYYTTYSLSGLNIELVDVNGDNTDGIDAQIAIDIEGVLADCRAATASALELTELMEPIYNRLKDIFPENYYTKTESDAKYHPLYGSRSVNLNANNFYVNKVHMINADGGDDLYMTNHTSNSKNFITIGNGSKVTKLPWPNESKTWTLATTDDVVEIAGGDFRDYYKKTETDTLLAQKQNTLVSGTNIKTVGGESLLGSTNVKPQYDFVASVDAITGDVTCSETYENLYAQYNSGRTIVANVSGALFYLESISGEGVTLLNHDGGKLRDLSLVYDEDETAWVWELGEKDMDAKPIIFDIEGTESGGVITYTLANGMTFADVDAALTAGKQVRFHDLFNYFDVVAYVPTVTVVAAYTSSTTNEKYTITSSSITREVTSLAPIASPALTGTPTAPTATSGTNTTQIATTAFVNTAAASAGAQGIASVTTPSTPDGTAVITLNNGNTITLNLTHIHDGLIATGEVDRIKFHVCEDETEYTGITTKDANTLYLIPASS